MTAEGRIVRPAGPGPWNPQTGEVDELPGQVIYTGPCRIQAQASAVLDAQAAGQEVTSRTYLVAIRHDAPEVRAGESGDVFIADEASDPYLVGRPMRIVDIQLGSLRWERDLICRDDLSANNP
jgi:hypothetical protein